MDSKSEGAVPDTRIRKVDDGSGILSLLTSGEEIYAENSPHRIQGVEERMVSEIYEVFCLDAHCISVSGGFYFRKKNKNTKETEWIQARSIHIGDWIVTENNMISIVGNVEVKNYPSTIYRICMESGVLYYANGFLTKSE